MSAPIVVLTVRHVPGPEGQTYYRAAITTNGIDRQQTGPEFTSPKEAQRYADRLQRRLDREQA